MRATFSGLEIARTGLTVSQLSLDVTGHNIANVDTKGYTRQRLVATAYDPNSQIGQFKPLAQSLVGGGARIMVHDQIRSAFLDRQFRTENTAFSYWQERTQGLSYVRSYFESVAETTINDSVASFFESVKTVSLNTVDLSQRVLMQQKGQLLAKNLNDMYDGLLDLQSTQDLAVDTMVKEINTIAHSISDLNLNIYNYELSGNYANDLRDKRNLLIDELSTIVDIEYYETGADYDRQLVIEIGGKELLKHINVNELQTAKVDNEIDGIVEGEKYEVQWGDGTPLDIDGMKGGKLKSTVDLRDGNSYDLQGIPYYLTQLNNLARSLAQSINKIHEQGFTFPYEGNASETGISFFDVPTGGIEEVTARNIKLSDKVAESPYNIACSSEMISDDVNQSTDKQSGNNIKINEIYDLFGKKDIKLTLASGNIAIGSFDGFMTGITLNIATTMNNSEATMINKNVLAMDTENQRYSISGVSLDEEMTNMVRFQHAYQGASRVINAMDEAIDILINRTGRVGL